MPLMLANLFTIVMTVLVIALLVLISAVFILLVYATIRFILSL